MIAEKYLVPVLPMNDSATKKEQEKPKKKVKKRKETSKKPFVSLEGVKPAQSE